MELSLRRWRGYLSVLQRYKKGLHIPNRGGDFRCFSYLLILMWGLPISLARDKGDDVERALPFLSEEGEPLELSVVNARQKPIR